MKIIISGYGRMGKEIEQAALRLGHQIAARIDNEMQWKHWEQSGHSADVVIDFSMPDAVTQIIERCFTLQLPVVTGTTGWYDNLERISENCKEINGTLFYAPNFSLGVNLFYMVNSFLARTMSAFDEYNVHVEEVHHVHKLDAPSGTAIRTAELILGEDRRYHSWKSGSGAVKGELPVLSERRGEVPGTHTVVYTSDADRITLRHEAKNRSGFALGAVTAAEWVQTRKGVFTMSDYLKDLL